jgi:ligand-binding SRPBCC domain-containing protein
MTQRIATSQWVPFPVELVFAFFANPTNLPYLTPLRMRMRIEDARIVPAPVRPVAADPARRFQSVAAGVGSEILISFYPIPWVPKRLSWMARITEFAWNSYFCDEQMRGPFASFHHRHGIEPETRDGLEGTRWGEWAVSLCAGSLRASSSIGRSGCRRFWTQRRGRRPSGGEAGIPGPESERPFDRLRAGQGRPGEIRRLFKSNSQFFASDEV